MSKIVLLTGSPRRIGNSQTMADSFAAAAEKLGAEVVRFDTAHMNVAPCLACEACAKNGKCFVDDDFASIARELEQADGVVFAAPVYWFTFPAQIKAVIDRLFSLCCTGKSFEGKKCALLGCCADQSPATFDGMKLVYERTVQYLKGENVGEVLVNGVHKAGDIADTDGLVRAAALAQKFA